MASLRLSRLVPRVVRSSAERVSVYAQRPRQAVVGGQPAAGRAGMATSAVPAPPSQQEVQKRVEERLGPVKTNADALNMSRAVTEEWSAAQAQHEAALQAQAEAEEAIAAEVERRSREGTTFDELLDEDAADSQRPAGAIEEELGALSPELRRGWQARMQAFFDRVYEAPDESLEGHAEGQQGVAADQRLTNVLAGNDPIRNAFLKRGDHPGDATRYAPYCVFCYHGTDILRDDNTKLLSLFVGPDGNIQPRRLTHTCATHQHKLQRVIKRSQAIGLLPRHHKLHPRQRFQSLRPDPVVEGHKVGLSLQRIRAEKLRMVGPDEAARRRVDEELQGLADLADAAERATSRPGDA